MRFLSIYKHAETNTPPTAEEMETMGQLVQEGFRRDGCSRPKAVFQARWVPASANKMERLRRRTGRLRKLRNSSADLRS